MSLAIVVPSVGRATLRNTLESIAIDLTNDDEVIVVTEVKIPLVKNWVDQYAATTVGEWVYGYPPKRLESSYGHLLRNYALDEAVTASHVWSIDDDDVALPGALTLLRSAACARPVIFKARWGAAHPATGAELWHDKRVALGNVATPMLLAPLCKARFHPPKPPLSVLEQMVVTERGAWYVADYGYAQDLVEELGEPIWRDEFVALIRPVTP